MYKLSLIYIIIFGRNVTKDKTDPATSPHVTSVDISPLLQSVKTDLHATHKRQHRSGLLFHMQ
jgi:hypothetical protein